MVDVEASPETTTASAASSAAKTRFEVSGIESFEVGYDEGARPRLSHLSNDSQSIAFDKRCARFKDDMVACRKLVQNGEHRTQLC